jgi:hypothetical protein
MDVTFHPYAALRLTMPTNENWYETRPVYSINLLATEFYI